VSGLLILLAGLAAAVASGVCGARALMRARGREAVLSERLAALRPEAEAARGGGAFDLASGPRFLRVRFARADLHLPRGRVYLGLAAVTAAGLAIAWSGRPLLGLAAVGACAAAAAALLEFVAARNVAALNRDLPFLLDGVRQHLTVGASLQQALVRAVESAGPDLQRAFLPMARRIQNGATVVEGLAWLSERIDVAEVDMLLVAVQTNTRFGGGMSSTLSNLSAILRDRARIGREMKAATAETRLSGWVLAGLPVLAILAIGVLNPVYAGFLTGTPLGHRMLAFAAGWQVIGCLAMSRIMRVDF
jgi:tight adherence protein B